VLDDFSRYIIAWKLCTTMKASDVTETLNMALEASGCDSANVIHKPRLLSDNGSSYISGELAAWLNDKGIDHVRGAPMHPQIKQWRQTLKNRILLENYYLPGDLELGIANRKMGSAAATGMAATAAGELAISVINQALTTSRKKLPSLPSIVAPQSTAKTLLRIGAKTLVFDEMDPSAVISV
jgi:transposase InsO family protein